MYDALDKHKSQKKRNFANWYREAVGGGEGEASLNFLKTKLSFVSVDMRTVNTTRTVMPEVIY
jgi:hypothetical protein